MAHVVQWGWRYWQRWANNITGGNGVQWWLYPGTLFDQEISWHTLVGNDLDVAWRILHQTDQATAFHILNDFAHDIAWRILHLNDTLMAWRIFNELPVDTSWRILHEIAVVTAWRIQNQFDQDVTWNIFKSTIEEIKRYHAAHKTYDFYLRPVTYEFTVPPQVPMSQVIQDSTEVFIVNPVDYDNTIKTITYHYEVNPRTELDAQAADVRLGHYTCATREYGPIQINPIQYLYESGVR